MPLFTLQAVYEWKKSLMDSDITLEITSETMRDMRCCFTRSKKSGWFNKCCANW